MWITKMRKSRMAQFRRLANQFRWPILTLVNIPNHAKKNQVEFEPLDNLGFVC